MAKRKIELKEVRLDKEVQLGIFLFFATKGSRKEAVQFYEVFLPIPFILPSSSLALK